MRIKHEKPRGLTFSDDVWDAIRRTSEIKRLPMKQVLQQSFLDKYPDSMIKRTGGK